MLVYFLRGRLPWQGLKSGTEEERSELILKEKQKTDSGALCAGLPEGFTRYMEYVRSLGHEDMPDYETLRNMFRRISANKRFEYDHVFDWTELIYLQRAHKDNR